MVIDEPVDREYERLTNTRYKSSDRKRWEFIQVAPCFFEPMHAWVIQRLQGDFGTPNEDGHDANGWRPEVEPVSTRLVYMEMQSDGQVVNVHTPKKKIQRD
jgi:hypothetical protein